MMSPQLPPVRRVSASSAYVVIVSNLIVTFGYSEVKAAMYSGYFVSARSVR